MPNNLSRIQRAVADNIISFRPFIDFHIHMGSERFTTQEDEVLFRVNANGLIDYRSLVSNFKIGKRNICSLTNRNLRKYSLVLTQWILVRRLIHEFLRSLGYHSQEVKWIIHQGIFGIQLYTRKCRTK
jgi:Tat protein secretion system quality control protein TatD with DNase activity